MDITPQLIEGTTIVGKWDYQARNVIMSNGDPELSFKRGQQMKLLKVLSSDWLRVEMVDESNTMLGVVPKSYIASSRNSLERVPSTDAPPPPVNIENNENLLEGKFDYTSNGIVMSNGDKDLSFRKYDKMLLVEQCPNQWVKVKLISTGEVGVVPANYVRSANAAENRKTIKPKTFSAQGSFDTDYATFMNITYETSRTVHRDSSRDRSQSDVPTSQLGSPKVPMRRALSEDHTSFSAPNSPTASPPVTPHDSPQPNRTKSKAIKMLGVSEDNIQMLSPSPQPEPKLDRQRSSSKLKKLLGVQENVIGKPIEYQFPESYPFRYGDHYERIIFALETSDNGIPLIRAATLEKLVEKLTHHESVDADFVYEFLLTFRCFTTTHQVLKLLKERYNTPNPVNLTDSKEIASFQSGYVKPMRLRISNVLKKWLEDHWYDFLEDSTLLNDLKSFLDEMKHSGMEASASALHKAIQKKQEGKRKESESSSKSRPDPIEPDMKLLTSLESTLQILAFNPLEIARQLTLIEFDSYVKIQPRECLGQHWSKKERQHKAENVVSLIQRFNKVSQWVTSTIVQIDNVKSRAEVLIKFIEVAEHMNKLNNISGMMQVAAGLRHSSIHRLKRTWAAVPSKRLKAWDEIVQLLDPYSNYSSLRNRMKTSPPPLLPYLGMFLTDFTFIEDGNPDDMSGLINFDKWRRLATSVKELVHFQDTPYNFVPLPILQAFLLAGGEYVDESMVYQMSLKIEPRQGGKVKTSSINWRKSTNVQKRDMMAQRAQSMQQFYAIKKKDEEQKDDSPKDESMKHRGSVDSQGSEGETPSPNSSFLSLGSEKELDEYLATLSISDSEKQHLREQFNSDSSRGSSRRGSMDEFEDPPLDELVELLIHGQLQKYEEYFEGMNPDQADSIKAQVNRLHHAVISQK